MIAGSAGAWRANVAPTVPADVFSARRTVRQQFRQQYTAFENASGLTAVGFAVHTHYSSPFRARILYCSTTAAGHPSRSLGTVDSHELAQTEGLGDSQRVSW